MKWYSSYEHPDQVYFIIEDHGRAGSYLYVYDNPDSFQQDLKDPEGYKSHQQDHDQDNPEMSRKQALEDFGVPADSWIRIF